MLRYNHIYTKNLIITNNFRILKKYIHSVPSDIPTTSIETKYVKPFFKVYQDVPRYKSKDDAININYEPLETYMEPIDWSPLLIYARKYKLSSKERKDRRDFYNITYAPQAIPLYKSRLDICISDLILTDTEREVFKFIVGNRYNKRTRIVTFVSRNLPSIVANENRVCQFLEMCIAKSQQLAWIFTKGDKSKTTFNPAIQFINNSEKYISNNDNYNKSTKSVIKKTTIEDEDSFIKEEFQKQFNVYLKNFVQTDD